MSSLATTLTIARSWSAAQLAYAFDTAPIWASTEPLANVSSMSNQDTNSWLVDRWNLDGKVGGASANLVQFVEDPFSISTNRNASTSNSDDNSSLVLGITYPSGIKGGVQFWPLPFDGLAKPPQRAVLTYQVAFEPGFNFVLGGKLPVYAGLYGGATTGECTGGNRQFSCFSTRFMWRSKGAGEVYAYIPTYPHLCNQSDISCPDKYGIQISLGAFNFTVGGWTTVTQLVGMNTPTLANGWLYVYINDTLVSTPSQCMTTTVGSFILSLLVFWQVIQHTGIVFRSDPNVTLSRVLFSTFFGGSTSAWYPSKTQHAYFRDFKVWASSKASNTTGPKVQASLHTTDTSEEEDAQSASVTSGTTTRHQKGFDVRRTRTRAFGVVWTLLWIYLYVLRL
ncbi:BQ5605_C001g00039 [Microbotryum silenes-dioicae]|uniref:BQ5605_C001g00039 protein n=1 Tax=Microbotryum silenes-dioicae TaxID=796604 RepID=A0A2X0M5M8_9BASI|nr:BQ5605_C001g00039 [Microbotryum silenes-dioicae]